MRRSKRQYNQAFVRTAQAALALASAHARAIRQAETRSMADYRAAQKDLDGARARASRLVDADRRREGFQRHQLHLSLVRDQVPAGGIVGLVIAVIFAATMSASSGEINSLATVAVVDIYKRYVRRDASDHHYLKASRWLTLFWGVYAVVFAGFGRKLGSLIVAVNVVGSLFYGSLLGCFVLALGFRRVGGTAAFIGMLAGEAAVLATAYFTEHLVALVQRDRLREWWYVTALLVSSATSSATPGSPQPRIAAAMLARSI